MEVRVQLKICEGCGSLFYRAQTQGSIYCRGCDAKLRNFPTPESRKRRGRPSRKSLIRVWAVADTTAVSESLYSETLQPDGISLSEVSPYAELERAHEHWIGSAGGAE
jgi:hypothetical protein